MLSVVALAAAAAASSSTAIPFLMNASIPASNADDSLDSLRRSLAGTRLSKSSDSAPLYRTPRLAELICLLIMTCGQYESLSCLANW